jgi:hypothetical protein
LVVAALRDIFPCKGVLLPVSLIAKGESYLEIPLLLHFLYQTLPSFISKTQIEFEGVLHDQIQRSVEILNPTSRAITYSAYLEGSPEFSIFGESTFTVSPRSQGKIIIQFLSTFERASEANLIVKTKKMGMNNTSILVFQLKGKVNGSLPVCSYTIDAPMYCFPSGITDVEVKNPFQIAGLFKISLRQAKVCRALSFLFS